MFPTEEAFAARSAAATYRKDAAGRNPDQGFGDADGTWIAIASLLEHAARSPGGIVRPLLGEAVGLAEEALRSSGAVGARRTAPEIIQSLAQQIEEVGAFHLAALVLTAYAKASTGMSSLEVGRFNYQYARILSKIGDLDAAEASYRRLSRFATEVASAELKARAFLGLTAVAQNRGFYDEMRRWSAAAARLAPRHKNPELARRAHNGLFVSAAEAANYDQALLHGWKAYEFSAGDAEATAEVLHNLGLLLLKAGHPRPARAAFAALLLNPQPPRIAIPTLGGYAVSSGSLGDVDAVQWAAREMDRVSPNVGQPYLLAETSLEIATALVLINDPRAAMRHRNVALATAMEHGLHGIVSRAQALVVQRVTKGVSDPSVLSARAARVARAIERLRPSQLPDHLLLVSAA